VTHSTRPLIGIPAASQASADPTPTYRFNGHYTAALAACDAIPLAIPLDLPEPILRDIFERLDGLLLAGGVDVDPAHYGEARHPKLGEVDAARDATELALARWALAADLPILGICRGIQSLNVAAGGSLYQDIASQIPAALRHDYQVDKVGWEKLTQRVRLAEASHLGAIMGDGVLADGFVRTNSFHHQAVKTAGEGFIVVAAAEDGVIEAIEKPACRFAIGVQWHPEGMFRVDAPSRRLFETFVAACRGEGASGARATSPLQVRLT
jgi:putative glutamine amidotransferase